jgi:antitoxin MazE
MEARVAKWGNSCGIPLPNSIIKALKMGEGTTVEIHMEKNHIVISKSKSYKLNDLLSKITSRNKHSEIATGPLFGDERTCS